MQFEFAFYYYTDPVAEDDKTQKAFMRSDKTVTFLSGMVSNVLRIVPLAWVVYYEQYACTLRESAAMVVFGIFNKWVI